MKQGLQEDRGLHEKWHGLPTIIKGRSAHCKLLLYFTCAEMTYAFRGFHDAAGEKSKKTRSASEG
jgi:hypothetical protein